MKFKKEYPVLVAIIAALSLYLAYSSSRDRMHYRLPQMEAIKRTEISGIEIFHGDESLSLRRQDGKWLLGPQGFPADERKIMKIVDSLADITLTALVSESKSYDRYDLGEEAKISVKAWSGDKLIRSFEIGKPAQSFQHTFVRLDGDHRVYHAERNLRQLFDQKTGDLRDMSVLRFDPNEIQEVIIEAEGKTFAFTRKHVPPPEIDPSGKTGSAPESIQMEQGGWECKGGEQVNQAGIDELLSTLSNLRCEGYVDDREKTDFLNPLCSIYLTGTEDYELKLFPKLQDDARQYPVVSSANDYPFLLTEGRAEELMKPEELIVDPDKTNENGSKGK